MVKNEEREQKESGIEAIPGCMKVARMQHPELRRLHVTSTHSTVQSPQLWTSREQNLSMKYEA